MPAFRSGACATAVGRCSISNGGSRRADLPSGVAKFIATIARLRRTSVAAPSSHRRSPVIAVLDDFFPQPLSGFRFEEFRCYLDEIPTLSIYSNGASLPLVNDSRSVEEVISSHLRDHPSHAGRIHPLSSEMFPDADMYYGIFLNNIYTYIDQIETKDRPFVFTLYPGGGFGIDQPEADHKMRRVFGSSKFNSVIATQPITRDYLFSKNYCREDQITYIPGGVIPRSAFDPPSQKLRYGFGKNQIDICFVANRYTPIGTEKGYDLFVEAAKTLCALGVSAEFHVVGAYDETTIDLGACARQIRFYGFRPREFFRGFYQQMDLTLAPTRPFVLSGMFDGFPTGGCVEAGLQAVAVMCTDELRLNTVFRDGDDIVIVRPDRDDIVARIMELAREPARLAKIGENGRTKMAGAFGHAAQLSPRIEILRSIGNG
jgi:glycosyltransferase involved in cell wall biosynthesis